MRLTRRLGYKWCPRPGLVFRGHGWVWAPRRDTCPICGTPLLDEPEPKR